MNLSTTAKTRALAWAASVLLAAACSGDPVEGSGGESESDGSESTSESSTSGSMTSGPSSDPSTTAGTTPGTTDPDPSTSASTDNPTTGVDPATSVDPSATTTIDPSTTTDDPTTGDPTTGPGCVEVEWFLDGDNDGYGDDNQTTLACDQPDGFVDQGGDCDDGDGNRNPGQEELCDDQDNDCDPLVDEYSPSNEMCAGCTLGEFGDSVYWFCEATANYSGSRTECMNLGAGVDLAIIGSQGEQDYIGGLIAGAAGDVWLGADDLVDQGTWVWVDDSNVADGYQNWNLGEPDNAGNAHCMVARPSDGLWVDRKCGDPNRRLCESAG